MKLSDVTIREGGQMPGRSYTTDQRVSAGQTLDELGVEFIQAGFAVASATDREAIERLAEQSDAAVVSLARAVESDVDDALAAGADVVDVFAPLSDKQLQHMVGREREEMVTAVQQAVDAVDDAGGRAHLTLVDAFRTDIDDVVHAFDRFDDVEYVGLADTVGAKTPRAVRRYLEELSQRGVDLGRTGVHFHDDLGVATANALVAAELGVGKADVSVASLGERAGNTALEELVVAGVIEREDSFGTDPSELVGCCHRVLDALDEAVDDRKPILGPEVTKHESGIHVAAMLSDPAVMEPFDPERFGGSRTLVFGDETGRSSAEKLLDVAGREPTDERVETLVEALAAQGPVDKERAVDLAASVE